MTRKAKPSTPERFWANAYKTAGCWIWTAGVDGKGYGRFYWKGKRVQAHRIACELAYGPSDLCACHKCDNPLCVNPDHLFWASASENYADMVRKGRNFVPTSPRGDAHWTRRPQEYADKIAALSAKRKEEFASGKRVLLKGTDGKILGTRIVA